MSRWERQSLIIGDAKLYVAFDEQTICIKTDRFSELIEDLKCYQDEADTRMLLHAQHVCHTTENVMIHMADTDVLIITIAVSTEFLGNLFIRSGTKNNTAVISVEKIKESLMLCYDLHNSKILSKSLLSFHAFTGCDTVSAFVGKGKLKPLKVMLKNQ